MSSKPEFSTKRLQLATFIHASGLLPYLRTEPHSDGKCRFVFFDEKGQARDLELTYEQGAKVVARDIFASQLFLRREMDDARQQLPGDSSNDYTRR
jgi:hypothetical protein